MRHLQRHVLDVDGLKAVDLAVKNNLHDGANKRLVRIRQQINMYAQKFKETAPLEKGHYPLQHQRSINGKGKKDARKQRARKLQTKKNCEEPVDSEGEEERSVRSGATIRR